MIISCYRDRFGLFWRIMMPCVLILLGITILRIFYDHSTNPPDTMWGFDTVNGISPKTTSKPENGNWGWSANFRFFSGETINGVTWGWVLYISWLSFGPLWIAMCPLILVVTEYQRNVSITARDAWRYTFRKIWHLLGAYLLLSLFIGLGVIIFVGLLLILRSNLNLTATLILMVILSIPITYFMVSWSLHNQCIILENLPIIAAFRRSRERIRGKWLKVIGVYIILTWGYRRIIAVAFGLIGLLLSRVSPEFATLGEELASGKFSTLFVGGYAGVTLGYSTSLWAIYLMEAVKVVINAFLLPIWAIFTTQLYLERGGSLQPVSTDETQQIKEK